MFGRPGLYAGRRLFACLVEDALIVRLPAEAARAALQDGATPFERGGRPTREWVAYRGRAAGDARRLQPLLEVAARHMAEQASKAATPARRASRR